MYAKATRACFNKTPMAIGRETECIRQNAWQPLALAAVSARAFRAVTHGRICGITAFCLVFGKNFNIMSALSVNQSPTLPQIIDSREGLCWYKKGGGMCMWQNEFLLEKTAVYTYFWAICG